jgi:hypothetical protein
MAELEVELLTLAVAVGMSEREPLQRWISHGEGELRLRAGDQALLIDGCEYHVERDTGAVMVLDHRDPRAMRSQRYEPGRPQPYMPPSVEDRDGW